MHKGRLKKYSDGLWFVMLAKRVFQTASGKFLLGDAMNAAAADGDPIDIHGNDFPIGIPKLQFFFGGGIGVSSPNSGTITPPLQA